MTCCGIELPDELGKYGCPVCCGDNYEEAKPAQAGLLVSASTDEGNADTRGNEMDIFKPTFDQEYALAKSEGDKRFGSNCEHAKVTNGVCKNCLRRVISAPIRREESKLMCNLARNYPK